ncbi:MAG: CHAD domain-containing protein [Puia sp.]|nr:CHAD domain-containing protein [Puia sp.]
MTRREIADAIRLRCKKMNKSLKPLFAGSPFPGDGPAAGREEEIHAFRVEVKRLRALVRMAAGIDNRHVHSKIPKKIRRYYRIMGRIRNILLQEERIRKALLPGKAGEEGAPPATGNKYLLLLEREVSGYRILAKAAAGDTDGLKKDGLKKTEKRWIRRLHIHPAATDTGKWVARQIQRIRRLLASGNPIGIAIHPIRKILKDLLYTWDFTGPYIAKQLPAALPLTREALEALTDRLGEFLDIAVAVDFLRPAYTDLISTEKERTLLLDLHRQWLEEMEQRGLDLHTLLNEIFSDNNQHTG